MEKESNSQMDFHLYKGTWVNTKAPHLYNKLSDAECKALLKRGGFIVRNTYHFDLPRESSFWFVIKDSFGGMDELSSKTRNQIRRAFNTLDIKIINKDLMLKEGYKVYLSAFEKYSVKSEIMSRENYEKMIENMPDNYDFWACIDKNNGHLIAYSMNIIKDNTCHYLSMKAIPEYLRGYYPFYGLLYAMNQHYLEDRKVHYVSDGARSITEHSNIQPFLIEKFKFRKAYCCLQLKYKWWLHFIVMILFPFRSLIPFSSVKAVLNMHDMYKKCNCI